MIRKAKVNEYEKALEFYYQLIDDMQSMEYHPKWQKGVYPDPEELKIALMQSELVIYEEAGEILAAMRVNHKGTDGYEKVAWAVNAEEDEVSVIHMLGVAVPHQRKGIAGEMVRYAIDTAIKNEQKALRLDVLTGNLPANRLYESIGFQLREKLTLFYEDTGLMDFELYELVLDNWSAG